MESALHICMLGEYQVNVDSCPIEEDAWKRRHAKLLVKLLALAPKQKLHREQLMELLWPEVSSRSSTNNLNKTLYMARRALEPNLESGNQSQFLHRHGEFIALQADGGLTIDVLEFEQSASLSRSVGTIDSLEAAIALYGGELLPEDRYDAAFDEKRESLQRQYLTLLTQLMSAEETAGLTQAVIETAFVRAQADPLNEQVYRDLMKKLADDGRHDEALVQYKLCAKVLQDELDTKPERATRQLYEALKKQSSELAESGSPLLTEKLHSEIDGNRIAVMPLEAEGLDTEFEYLCDGITESLILDLSRVPHLRILARSTVFRFKDQAYEPLQLRQQLQVGTLLQGRLLWDNGRLTLWMELVDTSNNAVRWAERYTGSIDDTLRIQNEISSAVTLQMQSQATYTSVQSTAQKPTADVGAYHSYLKGRYHWNKRTGSSLLRAKSFFRAAIEQDPVYALAYAGLADTYNLLSLYTVASPNETMPKARAAARTALDINPELAEAHCSLAYCQLSYDWDWQAAERSFGTALGLNPGYATAHAWFHKLLVARGRFDEATQQIELAGKLDPLSPMIGTEAGWGYYHSRQFQRAIAHLEVLLDDEPDFTIARFILALACLQTDQTHKCLELLTRLRDGYQSDNPFVLAIGVTGVALTRIGKIQDAKQLLSQINTEGGSVAGKAYASALIYAALDQPEDAIRALEIAFAERYDRLIFLSVEPLFDSLRVQPEFAALVAQLEAPRFSVSTRHSWGIIRED
ncbi:MAG: hypothetical protein KTR32_14690 [Granulosicoccus sp.]|nr:hypothetical protein [Granulosicoccus sp.]